MVMVDIINMVTIIHRCSWIQLLARNLYPVPRLGVTLFSPDDIWHEVRPRLDIPAIKVSVDKWGMTVQMDPYTL